MARKARIYGKNGDTYSIHCRINDKNIMRFHTVKIAIMFFSVVKEAKKKFKFSLNLLTLMGNHFHLKIVPNNNIANISRIMHWINFTTAMRYNKLTGHTGRLWRERYKSYILNNWTHYINTGAYIARNPERAKIGTVENYHYGSAIFLYKLNHPIPEFEKFRNLFDEPFKDYFQLIKNLIQAQKLEEQYC